MVANKPKLQLRGDPERDGQVRHIPIPLRAHGSVM